MEGLKSHSDQAGGVRETMQKEAVKKMLTSYREDLARCQYLEHEIPQLERLVDELRSTMIEDSVSITQVISDMPRGTSISDPTGRLGMLFASGYVPDHIRKVEDEIKIKKREMGNKLITVTLVDSAMNGLSDREAFVIKKKYIEGVFWRELIPSYRDKFDMLYSKSALKKVLETGLDKMARIMQ